MTLMLYNNDAVKIRVLYFTSTEQFARNLWYFDWFE